MGCNDEDQICKGNKEPTSISMRVLKYSLQLPDIVERDKVFNFIIGLKACTCNEVKRQNIKTLEEAFAVVDCLVENYDEGIKERE